MKTPNRNHFESPVSPPANSYKTASYPYPDRTDSSELFNLQICTCGHDRCAHSEFLGHGSKRVIVLNCQHAGHCGVGTCGCEKFVFSNKLSGPDGKKRYKLECDNNKIHPPQTKKKGRKGA